MGEKVLFYFFFLIVKSKENALNQIAKTEYEVLERNQIVGRDKNLSLVKNLNGQMQFSVLIYQR